MKGEMELVTVKNVTMALITITIVGLSYVAVEQAWGLFHANSISQAVRSIFIPEPNATLIAAAAGSDELEVALVEASMPDRTVIITTVNGAWMEPNGLTDLFLESFRIGAGTRDLLNNLLIVAMDEMAFNRCREIHPHCYNWRTQGLDFSGEKKYRTQGYFNMTQSKILFLKNVLDRGYNFIFSDTDILWLRNPFHRLLADADFQVSTDWYNHRPYDISNPPNTGFKFVRSNQRTIEFYEFWHASTSFYPDKNDQDVLNQIKSSANLTRIGLKLVFLDTQYFSGFCQSGTDLGEVCTMHANCCVGLKAKVGDLRAALEDWTLFQSFNPNIALESRRRKEVQWRYRYACKQSMH